MTQEVPPRLDDLTVDQLNEMASAIVGLKEAGYLMQEQGFDARFSLVPGFPVSMKLSYRMPLPSPMQALFPAPPIDSDTATGQHAKPEWRATPMPKPAKPKGPTAAEVDAAVNAACNKVLPMAAAMAAEGPTEKLDVRPVVDTVAPVATPEPPKAETASIAPPVAAAGKPAPWTEDEELRLIDLVARGIVEHGKTKGAAIAYSATLIGRPFEGAGFRLNTKLKDRLAARIEELRGPQPAAVAKDPPEPIATPEPTPTGNAHWRPEAAPAAVGLSPIEQHLLDMPTKGGWTMEADLDLLELAENGWSIPEIATEMGRDGKAVAERFDLLTGYDRDTKTRKWKRADLLAAAREWTAKTKPAAAAE